MFSMPKVRRTSSAAPCRCRAPCCAPRPISNVDGLTGEYFAAPSFDGKPEMTRVDKEIDFDWAFANPVPSLSAHTEEHSFAVRWTGTIAAPVAETDNFQHPPAASAIPAAASCSSRSTSTARCLNPLPLRTPHGGRKAAAERPKLRRTAARSPFPSPTPIRTQLRIEYIQSGKHSNGGIILRVEPAPRASAG